jgi:hypothetical protein
MNWGQVKALATSSVHRKDISFDDLQQLALDDINLNLTVQENEAIAPLTLVASPVANLCSTVLPADFARPRGVFASSQEYIATDIQGLIARGAANSSYFAISGKSLYTGAAGDFTLVYSTRYLPLTSDSAESDLTDIYSQVLLYALMKHAAHRIQDFDAEKDHQAEFDYQVGIANSNYALATLTAGAEVRTGYGRVSN